MYKLIILIFLGFCEIGFSNFYSQNGQDQYLHEHFFKKTRNGVFVDIGAHDGVTYSNTCFFEKEMGWTGVCVEPMPIRFAELQKNRACICVNGCATDWNGPGQFILVSSPNVDIEMLSVLERKCSNIHLKRIKSRISKFGGSYQIVDVNCFRFNDLLEKNNLNHIDLLSIDTEGGELDILNTIDFSRFTIDVILVEDNYRDGSIEKFLISKGFSYEIQMKQDLIFIRN